MAQVIPMEPCSMRSFLFSMITSGYIDEAVLLAKLTDAAKHYNQSYQVSDAKEVIREGLADPSINKP